MKNKNQTRSRFKSLQLLFFLLAMGTFRLSAYEDAKSAIAAADALRKNGKLDEAIAVYNEACKLAEPTERYYPRFWKASILAQQKKIQEAVDALNQILEDPASKVSEKASALFYSGSFLMNAGKNTEALSFFNKISELPGENWQLYIGLYNTGNILLSGKKYMEADAAFQKILDLRFTPVDYQVHALIGQARILQSQKQLEKALEKAEKAVSLIKNNDRIASLALNKLAEIQNAMGKDELSEKTLIKVIALEKAIPDQKASACLALYAFYKKSGKKEDGRKILETARNISGISPHYKKIIEREIVNFKQSN